MFPRRVSLITHGVWLKYEKKLVRSTAVLFLLSRSSSRGRYTLAPSRGSISPSIALRRLDLPDPTAPTTATRLPASRVHVMSLSVTGSAIPRRDPSRSLMAECDVSAARSSLLSFPSEAEDLAEALLLLLRPARLPLLPPFFLSLRSSNGATARSGWTHANDPPVSVTDPGFATASDPAPSSPLVGGGGPFTTYCSNSGRRRYFPSLLNEILD
mmetsp:Transcript_6805/g.20243  ORF Transcript_6805/g.20243 Transcript_6805/m.20243 type:complete len:213 (-) Transcript_6805:652-1290(-)